MELHKINIKWFVDPPDGVPLADFIDIFHSWIQATEGAYHDVADYSHMRAGPGIVLIAPDANLSIDESGNRRGVLYSRKKPLDGTAQERLRSALRLSLENFQKLESEPALQGKFRLRGDEVLITLNDRLRWPNTNESLAEIAAELAPLAKVLFSGAEFRFEGETDSRKRLAVRVVCAQRFSSGELLERLTIN